MQAAGILETLRYCAARLAVNVQKMTRRPYSREYEGKE